MAATDLHPPDRRLRVTWELECRYRRPSEERSHLYALRRYNGRHHAERVGRRWLEDGHIPGEMSQPTMPNRTAELFRRERVSVLHADALED